MQKCRLNIAESPHQGRSLSKPLRHYSCRLQAVNILQQVDHGPELLVCKHAGETTRKSRTRDGQWAGQSFVRLTSPRYDRGNLAASSEVAHPSRPSSLFLPARDEQRCAYASYRDVRSSSFQLLRMLTCSEDVGPGSFCQPTKISVLAMSTSSLPDHLFLGFGQACPQLQII